jgi:hypothetical protein
MGVYVVRKWPLRGRSRFVCWNITRVSLWLLCNVMSRTDIRPTIATWPSWPKGTDHCNSEKYRCTHVGASVARTWISYRCVPVVHTSNISSYQKNFFSFPMAVNNSIKVGPLVFLLQMFVITENIMKRPVLTTEFMHHQHVTNTHNIFKGSNWLCCYWFLST